LGQSLGYLQAFFHGEFGRSDLEEEHYWDLQDILEYETDLIEVFSSALRFLSNVTLLDCGADIGLFSAAVCSRSDRVARVFAFEPNPDIQAEPEDSADNGSLNADL
jgi:hypothetical protein